MKSSFEELKIRPSTVEGNGANSLFLVGQKAQYEGRALMGWGLHLHPPRKKGRSGDKGKNQMQNGGR